MSAKDKKGSTGSLHHQLGKEHDDQANVRPTDEESSEQQTELLDFMSYETLQKQLTETEEKAIQAEEKVSQYWERMQRMQAESDNLSRRAKIDIEKAHKFALEKFALELLPVVDNLERAIASHAQDESGADTLLDGVSLTLKMFVSAIEKFGILQIDPQGELFNPELHQAVSTQAEANAKSGTVLHVLQKGYLLNNRLIRPALVIVAK